VKLRNPRNTALSHREKTLQRQATARYRRDVPRRSGNQRAAVTSRTVICCDCWPTAEDDAPDSRNVGASAQAASAQETGLVLAIKRRLRCTAPRNETAGPD